jgi:uncharacterized protein YidB (DUF937 family)
MGLLDVLSGMAHGPRGTPEPTAPGSGMSKTTMALLALLAYKAYRNLSSPPAQTQAQAPAPSPSRYPRDDRDERDARRDDRDDRDSRRDDRDDRYGSDNRYAPQRGGGLGDMLRDILGRGSVPGPVLKRGVDNTVRDLENSGHGEIARSWVGRGENRPITSRQLEAALGEHGIRDLMEQTGMERDELLETLSQHLPRVIDHLTPEGRLPTNEEAARMG